jgi:NADP-reducing hydrogenase subunit HndC
MVDFARYFIDFAQKESCGECIPCRLGTRQLLTILTDITEGRGRPGDIDLLEKLAEGVKAGALCGLGQTAPNPVLTTVRYFRDEYEAHIDDGRCPAGVCRELIRFIIDEKKCTGCRACVKVCPQDAITGEKKKPHVIDEELCVKCGLCRDRCKFDAIKVC